MNEEENNMSVFALRREREDAIDILRLEYPRAFFSDPRRRVPLKHAIEEDIKADLAKNKNSKLLHYDIDDAVDWYRSHVSYKKCCSVAGSGRVDLHGVVVAKVTEAEARIAEQKAAEGFAEIEARKAEKKQILPNFVTQPPVPARQVRALPVNTALSTVELLTEIEKQSAVVRSVLGEAPDDVLRRELVRPALQLMIDELQTIVARLDQKTT
jgi:sRNA-binding protein